MLPKERALYSWQQSKKTERKSEEQLLLYHNSNDKMQSCSPIALVFTGLLMWDSGSTSTGVILLLPSALLIPFLYFSVQKTQWESLIPPLLLFFLI